MEAKTEAQNMRDALERLRNAAARVVRTAGTLVTSTPDATPEDRAAMRELIDAMTGSQMSVDALIVRTYAERIDALNGRSAARLLACNVHDALEDLIVVAKQSADGSLEPAIIEASRVAVRARSVRAAWRRSALFDVDDVITQPARPRRIRGHA